MALSTFVDDNPHDNDIFYFEKIIWMTLSAMILSPLIWSYHVRKYNVDGPLGNDITTFDNIMLMTLLKLHIVVFGIDVTYKYPSMLASSSFNVIMNILASCTSNSLRYLIYLMCALHMSLTLENAIWRYHTHLYILKCHPLDDFTYFSWPLVYSLWLLFLLRNMNKKFSFKTLS